MTYTPGPWLAHNIGLGPNGEGPFTYPLGTDPDKAAANARLIAAAPDMLAALEELVKGMEEHGAEKWFPHRMARAHAAIAKAKGNAPCGK